MYVIDSEGIGLGAKATKLYVLSYTQDGETVHSLTDYDDMREFLSGPGPFVCHNSIRHDNEAFKAVLGIDVGNRMYDTLAVSWYMEPSRLKHGLAEWGEFFGVPKPPVDDWENLPLEVYIHRCEEDVKINHKLWVHLSRKMMKVYRDSNECKRMLRYLSFKMTCAAEQERIGWRVDIDKVNDHIAELEKQQAPKVEELKSVMPLIPVYKVTNRPKNMFKKDKTLSAHGVRWKNLLKQEGLPDVVTEIKTIKEMKAPNPNSPDQVKEWLFSMGWKPCTYKLNDKKNKVPQIRVQGQLTKSVEALAEREPKVKVLEGLTVIQHRLGVFKGFRDQQEDGWLKAQIEGLTNTLRFKHKKPLVNLPGVDKPWGKEIRGCLIAPDEDHTLCGTDMVSLEATTKRHYMYPFDPEYVAEMSQPGFDEHLDLAVKAGHLTREEYNYYADCDDESDPEWKRIHGIRKTFKPVNYASVYGVQAKRLSDDNDMSIGEAQKLIDAYWERNHAVLKAVEQLKVRVVDKEMWLLNPVSNFYYSLRFEKDKFSTLNQGTGVFCFDTWVAFCRSLGVKICGQFHDEHIDPVLKGEEEEHERKLKKAIVMTNEKIKLNVELDVDVKFGSTYSEIH